MKMGLPRFVGYHLTFGQLKNSDEPNFTIRDINTDQFDDHCQGLSIDKTYIVFTDDEYNHNDTGVSILIQCVP